jgi:m7GpppX diphosphatase
LEGTAEPETEILTHSEEEFKLSAFTLRKDLKYNSGDLKTLYCMAVPFRKDIKTIRDLNENHLDMLESMHTH